MKSQIKKSPVALAVLALLFEEPMHTYKMWQVIKERAKDEVVNVKYRNTLYQTIDRLIRGGLIAEKEIKKEENRPEQTIYELTDTGRETALNWMREMLAEPVNEFPEFPVALAYLPLLDADEVKELLRNRVDKLHAEITRIKNGLEGEGNNIPRLFLLEMEFILMKLTAEKNWVNALIKDISNKKVYWSDEWLNEIFKKFKNEN